MKFRVQYKLTDCLDDILSTIFQLTNFSLSDVKCHDCVAPLSFYMRKLTGQFMSFQAGGLGWFGKGKGTNPSSYSVLSC